MASAVASSQDEPSVALLPGEEEQLQEHVSMATKDSPGGQAYNSTAPMLSSGSPLRPVRSRTGPAAVSTPLVKKRSFEQDVPTPDVTSVENDSEGDSLQVGQTFCLTILSYSVFL